MFDFSDLPIIEKYLDGYQKVVLSLLEENKWASYLDIGCGDGIFTIRMANKIKARTVYGLDCCDISIAEAKGIGLAVKKVDLNEDIISLGDNLFDVITSIQVIEHISNTDIYIKEMFRLLKPGGYAIISTPNLSSWHIIIMLALGIHPPQVHVSDFGYKQGEVGEPLHRRLFTFPGLRKALRMYGFIIEKQVASTYLPLPTVLSKLMCKVDRNHASCINIKVRKL